ncbi:MAG: Crp/Fnr family transcriptional regulator [Bacteroidota bacterium]
MTKNNNIHLPYESLLTPDDHEEIAGKSNTVKYANKDIIFKQDTRTSHIMFVNTGLVKIYKEGQNGRNHILKLAQKKDFIGLMSIMGGEIFQYSASAIGEVEVSFVDNHVFRNILLRNGKYSIQVMKTISAEGLYIFDKLLNQAQKQLPGRIADVILYFSNVIYESDHFTFPLTRKELAELAGTTKESFIRTLTEFKNDKIIELDGSNVKIMSSKIIKTLSELG